MLLHHLGSASLVAVSICAVCISAATADAQAPAPGPHVCVDNFGYRPEMAKVAVLRQAVVGFDAPDSYTPGPRIEVRRVRDNSIALQGPASAWNAGAVHPASGDRAWSFDFTALREAGEFYIFDPSNSESSESFRIASDVYEDVLKAAVRMYFYQRCGTAKATPHAHPDWDDTPCHVAAQQDTDCRAVLDPSPATSMDLSGGWHDAGDYNKYVNFADAVVHDLLTAYAANPAAWTDDYGLPESGNGVPDLLDEVRFELEWLLKMQLANGSMLHKVSVTDFSAESPPSADVAPRRYAPPTASATISGAGVFAHAAKIYAGLPASAGAGTFATRLRSAALAAWGWLEANPQAIPSNYDNAGFVNVAAEDEPYGQEMNRIRAAVHLFRLTGQARFRDYVDANYGYSHLFLWGWAAGWELEWQDALATYAKTAGATPATAAAILNQLDSATNSAQNIGSVTGETDPYRAPIGENEYVWGSNRHKATTGLLFASLNRHGRSVADAQVLRDAAAGYLHYLHGLNPLGMAFLTNMGNSGADRSANQMYHAWFADGTVWDDAQTSLYGPAPGFVTGGPNASFAPDPAYTGPPIVPPMMQPQMKSYLDWNAGWPEASWSVTEPHIPYQASYIRLLAEFTAGPTVDLGLDAPLLLDANAAVSWRVGGGAPGSTVAIIAAFDVGRFRFDVPPSLCIDLGLDLFLPLSSHVLFLGALDANGTQSWSFTLPAVFPRIDSLRYQAVLGNTCPGVAQSAVFPN